MGWGWGWGCWLVVVVVVVVVGELEVEGEGGGRRERGRERGYRGAQLAMSDVWSGVGCPGEGGRRWAGDRWGGSGVDDELNARSKFYCLAAYEEHGMPKATL
ncbi:hypothetical protein BDZ91DRAFT_782227 [Kalaharituber pfeilii]|nr:hypothetical protein BDZ91DRAFT_782227 [Kalaharituber pfeilii]